MGTRQDLKELIDLLDNDCFKPVVHREFPLKEVRQAHEILEQNEQMGKVVLSL